MFSKINFKLFGIAFLASNIISNAMDNGDGVVTVYTQVQQPQCILWLHDNIVAIGGYSGVELVNAKGELISPKFNRTRAGQQEFCDTIYQLVPSNKPSSWYLAVDKDEYHQIDSFHAGILGNTTHGGDYFFIDENNTVKKHNESEQSVFNILLHPHRTSMPKNILLGEKQGSSAYSAATMYSPQLLALLKINNVIEFWSCNPEEPNAQYITEVNIDQHVQPSDRFAPFAWHKPLGGSQYLSFAPNLLHIAVVLRTHCFIVPVPYSVFSTCSSGNTK